MVADMNGPLWHVCVLIPAKDEERLLPRCLVSVIQAAERLKDSATTDVVVAADRSTDRTAQIAKHMLHSRGSVIGANAGAAGGARSVAAKVALNRTRVPFSRCWLANTDADCLVPPDWLTNQLELAHSGVEAYAGTVSVDSFEDHGPEVPQRFRESYRIEPDGSHPHIHAANLGVRADAYIEAGGWARLATGEDHELWAGCFGAEPGLFPLPESKW